MVPGAAAALSFFYPELWDVMLGLLRTMESATEPARY